MPVIVTCRTVAVVGSGAAAEPTEIAFTAPPTSMTELSTRAYAPPATRIPCESGRTIRERRRTSALPGQATSTPVPGRSNVASSTASAPGADPFVRMPVPIEPPSEPYIVPSEYEPPTANRTPSEPGLRLWTSTRSNIPISTYAARPAPSVALAGMRSVMSRTRTVRSVPRPSSTKLPVDAVVTTVWSRPAPAISRSSPSLGSRISYGAGSLSTPGAMWIVSFTPSSPFVFSACWSVGTATRPPPAGQASWNAGTQNVVAPASGSGRRGA